MLMVKRQRGRPPKITFEQYVRIAEVRDRRAAIPTDKELASELGVSIHTIRTVMKRYQRQQ